MKLTLLPRHEQFSFPERTLFRPQSRNREARHDPVLGAFISPDPILDTATPQQWGPYAYSENNPTTYSDPTGLISNIVMHDGSLGRGRKATTAPTASVGKRQSLQTLLGPPGPTKAPPVITRTKPGLVPAPEPRDTGRVIAGIGHGILEGLGLIPGAGEFFDLGNAIWYGVERDTENVLWSAASAIPIAGMIVPPGKWIAKGIRAADSAPPAVRAVDDIALRLASDAPVPLGRGSTGRTTPRDLHELMAMAEVRSAPAGVVLTRIELTDPRWPGSDGWVKMQQIVNGVNIHYVHNPLTGAVDDFKFN
ncbi:RHS repeat-associated core domain-containing protein [Salana multivorans]